ncbi:MAG: CapA family protein [Treponema sp.]|nr:CapA family protein [Treponema sp.]
MKRKLAPYICLFGFLAGCVTTIPDVKPPASAALAKAESAPVPATTVPESAPATLAKAEPTPIPATTVPESAPATLAKAEPVPVPATTVPESAPATLAKTEPTPVPATTVPESAPATLAKAEPTPVPATTVPEPMALASMVEEPQPVIPPPTPDFLSIVAVGDNLFHDPMIKPQKDGSFNYDSYYTEIKPIVQAADIAFVNQETVLAGKSFGYSGYPQFNTPQEAGLALINAGFNVVNQATNHIMDKGEKAVFATMDFWDKYPKIAVLGVHRSQEERDKQIIIEKNNIRTGFLSYTYGTNGIPVPKDKPYLVSLIDEKVMAKEIDALRPNCDLLVVSMHWGEEYRRTPTAEQKRLAQFLADRRVDVIIGHHPHVLEGTVTLTGKNGNETFCVYSLGNFISNQADSPTLLGGLLSLRIKKFEGTITIESAKIIPLVTHYEAGSVNFKVYPLYEYTEELAKKHTRRIQGKELGVQYFTNLARTVLGDAMQTEDPSMNDK